MPPNKIIAPQCTIRTEECGAKNGKKTTKLLLNQRRKRVASRGVHDGCLVDGLLVLVTLSHARGPADNSGARAGAGRELSHQ